MSYRLAERIVSHTSTHCGNHFYASKDLTFLMSILLNKLEAHAPEEYDNFKNLYINNFFPPEVL